MGVVVERKHGVTRCVRSFSRVPYLMMPYGMRPPSPRAPCTDTARNADAPRDFCSPGRIRVASSYVVMVQAGAVCFFELELAAGLGPASCARSRLGAKGDGPGRGGSDE